jgi:hypothetical protein
VKESKVTLEKFELRAPRESEATTWGPGSAGELHVWIKNEGEVLMNYPSVILESEGQGLVVVEGLKVLYGIGDSTRVTWTVRAAPDQAPGAKLAAGLRVFAYNEDLEAGKDPVGRGQVSLEVGQSFAK